MLQESKTNELEYQRLSKEEMEQRGILGRLVGVVADFISPTRNGRKYPEKLWENVFNDPIMKERIDNGVCYGELGHPADREETDMEKIAVCMAEQPKKGRDGKLRAVFDILNTPNGRILKSLCDYGSTLGISSRGSGDLETDFDGQESVNPDTYNCEGFDVVLIPAVKEARLQYVTEALDKKRYNKTLREKLTESINKETEEHQKVINESLSTLGVDLTESQYNDYEKKKYIVRYINSADKSAYTKVEASSKEEARKLAKKKLGKECFHIHSVELSESLNKILSEGYNFEAKPFDYTLYIDDESFPVNSANVIIPNGIKDTDGITYDLVICCLDKDENPINFETVAEAQSWIDEFSDNVKLECRGDTVYAIPQNTEWVDNQELDESISLDEASLTPEEKMSLWHAGQRNENIKACGDAKLYKYREICKNNNYVREVGKIDAELKSRGLSIPEDSAQVWPKKIDSKPSCFMQDGELHILFDDAGKNFISNYVNIGDVERLLTGGKEYFVIRKSDTFADKLAQDLIKILNENYVAKSLAESWGFDNVEEEETLNIETSAAENDGAMMEDFQQLLSTNQELQEKIVVLQEKLSVSYAKEMSLTEELNEAKEQVSKLSDFVNKNNVLNEQLTTAKSSEQLLTTKCKKLTESIDRKNVKLQQFAEQVTKREEQVQKLQEQLQIATSTLTEKENTISEITNKYETLNTSYQQMKENYSKKIESQNNLVEKYRDIAVKSVNKYIDTQATRLGVKSAEIKNRLPESYSFKDIDAVCNDLQEYNLNISSLPFTTNGKKLDEGLKFKAQNVDKRVLVPVEEELDDLTLRLAGL